MNRVLARFYGLVSSRLFLGDVQVLKTIDSGSSSRAFCLSLLVNLGRLGLFGRQHSGMGRPTQKPRSKSTPEPNLSIQNQQ